MTKEITLKFIDNQSHGYIQISKYDLESLDIDIKDIGSQYSFYILCYVVSFFFPFIV